MHKHAFSLSVLKMLAFLPLKLPLNTEKNMDITGKCHNNFSNIKRPEADKNRAIKSYNAYCNFNLWKPANITTGY